MRIIVLAGVLGAVTLAAPLARAADPTKKECIDANAEGQSQQKVGKLRAAQSSLRLCASSACPGAVRDDCAQRLDDLERVIPSLVFEAKDAAGKDFTVVRVKVDGQSLTDKLDGTALAVDPGEHTFTFEVAGYAPVTRTLVLREGDRSRRERVLIGPESASLPASAVTTTPPSTDPTVAPAATETTSEAPSTGSGQRIGGIVLGSVGIIGLGVGGLLGGLASSKWSSAKSCVSATAVACTDRAQAISDHDSAVGLATGSTIAFIAGGALLVTGVIVFLTAPKHATTTASVRLVPSIGPGGGSAMIVGSF